MAKKRDPDDVKKELQEAEQRVATLQQELQSLTGQQPKATPRPGPGTVRTFGPPKKRE